MKILLKIILGRAPILAILVLGLLSGYSRAIDGIVGNEVLRVTPSPDGAYKAVVFESDCGTMNGCHEKVSVLSAETKLSSEEASTFEADGDPIASQNSRVQVRWAGNNALVITHHPKARIAHAERQVHVKTGLPIGRTINVSYVE